MVTIFPFFIFHFPNFSALPLSLNANESKNENEKTYGTYLKSNQMMCNNFNIIRMRIDHSKTLSWPLVSLLWLLSWGQQIMLSVRLPRYSESHVQSAESGPEYGIRIRHVPGAVGKKRNACERHVSNDFAMETPTSGHRIRGTHRTCRE